MQRLQLHTKSKKGYMVHDGMAQIPIELHNGLKKENWLSFSLLKTFLAKS